MTLTRPHVEWPERPDGAGDDSYRSKWADWGLYVFHDRAGNRLYAGITSRDFRDRWEEHATGTDSAWWYAEIDWDNVHTERLGHMYGWEAEQNHEIPAIQLRGGTLANNRHNQNLGYRYVASLKARAGVFNPQPAPPARGELLVGFVEWVFPYAVGVATLAAMGWALAAIHL